MNKKLSEEISFGEWLRQRRRMLDLTQQELADQVGCARITLRRIESGALKPSKELSLILLEKLGIPVTERSKWTLFARGNLQVAPISRDQGNLSNPNIHLATFLFTDIEDSAKLWETARNKMKVALQRHHTILQEAISMNGGTVFQIVGDGFCAAFPTAPYAISAAVTAQRKLDQEPWDLPFPICVRMGIHTGEAEPISNDSPTGGYASNRTLNRVARILDAAHGGQILLSLVTKELVEDSLPENTELGDMGEHYLRNLMRPEHLFQLNIAGLQSEFPPLNTLRPTRHNLPVQLTSFIGREKEQVEILKLISKYRLVTLIGSGGVGKTRLSLKIGEQSLEDYVHGVWLVELAPILDPLLVPRVTATSIGLRDEPRRPVIDMLSDYLGEKKMLIILDNCEHLLDACAELVDTLLKSCPNLKFLATSREALGIMGEAAYRVPSLGLPDLQQALEKFRDYESVRLFEERAQLAQVDFSLTIENTSSVAKICNRLDGIPLAIELAAARVSMLSTEQIAARLQESFNLLTGGSRTGLPQHHTLRAAIDWSYDLLSPTEQTLFQRLSVFVDGWTLEAAESIAADANMKSEDILDLLSQLINKSLVNKEEIIGKTRYRMLETIREYAFKNLSASGEMRTICFRHLIFFAEMIDEAERNFKGPDQASWYNRLDNELDNLRVALTWFEGVENAEVRLRFTAGLWRYWKNRGHTTEGREHLRHVLQDLPPGPTRQTSAYARALTAAGSLAYYEGDLSYSDQSRKEALTIFRNLDDKVGIADCLNGLGNTAISQGNYGSALEYYQESLLIRRDLGDKWGIARLLGNLGLLAYLQMDYIQARSLHFESLTLFRELRDEEGVANELVNLGDVVRHQGELSVAHSYYQESAAISEKLKDQWGLGYALMGTADVALAQSDFSTASLLYRDCLVLFQKGANYVGLPFALESVAALALMKNQPKKAVQILGTADNLRKNTNSPLPLPDHSAYKNNLSLLQRQLDPSIFDLAWTAGRKMSLNQALELALKTVEAM